MQQRKFKHNPLTDVVFGSIATGVQLQDETIDGTGRRAARARLPNRRDTVCPGCVFPRRRLDSGLVGLVPTRSVATSAPAPTPSSYLSNDPARAAAPVPRGRRRLLRRASLGRRTRRRAWRRRAASRAIGDSAGGNLAAVVCLLARDRSGPANPPPGPGISLHRPADPLRIIDAGERRQPDTPGGRRDRLSASLSRRSARSGS